MPLEDGTRRFGPRRNAGAAQDVSITPAFSRGNSFSRFPAPANRDTWLRSDSRVEEGGDRLVAGGRQESGKLLATGASLVARNSTRAFLEFPAAPGYAGDTNFARTFPWKRPPPSPWVGWHTGEKGIGEGDVAEATDGGFLKGRRLESVSSR